MIFSYKRIHRETFFHFAQAGSKGHHLTPAVLLGINAWMLPALFLQMLIAIYLFSIFKNYMQQQQSTTTTTPFAKDGERWERNPRRRQIRTYTTFPVYGYSSTRCNINEPRYVLQVQALVGRPVGPSLICYLSRILFSQDKLHSLFQSCTARSLNVVKA